MTPKFLSTEEVEHFVNRGYVTVRDAFPRERALERTAHAFTRLGYDRNDPATWVKPRVHMTLEHMEDLATYSPKAFAAGADLVGGVERMKLPAMFSSEGFIVNFNAGADQPWVPPSATAPGWHKDGNWFIHFLDSPEEALLMIFIFSDIEPRGGGTFGAPDSIGVVSRLLAAHPEGLDPSTKWTEKPLISECHEFVEWTGKAGDVVLMHPFMLHAASQNHSGVPRFIINPGLSLVEPMNFNRANADDYSPVELGVLRGLGVDRYEFRATGERRNVVPAKFAEEQRKLREEEERRMAGVGGAGERLKAKV